MKGSSGGAARFGAWALAETQRRKRHEREADRLLATCRVVFALVLVYVGIEHLLHPDFAPSVPLEQMTPVWIPFRSPWGYIVGARELHTTLVCREHFLSGGGHSTRIQDGEFCSPSKILR